MVGYFTAEVFLLFLLPVRPHLATFYALVGLLQALLPFLEADVFELGQLSAGLLTRFYLAQLTFESSLQHVQLVDLLTRIQASLLAHNLLGGWKQLELALVRQR